jgi:major type 1 subunit fimbrin (pilin)
MKSSVFFNACLIAATCFSVNNAANALSGGTITFNGKITASTCSSSVDGSGADTVTLPTVSVDDFTGQTAGETAFDIKLTGCDLTDPDTAVGVYFEPDAAWVDSATGHLINLSTDADKTGVSLQLLYGKTKTPVKAGDNSQETTDDSFVTPDVDGNASIPYVVEYYKMGTTVAAGAVQGKVTYSLIYK